MGLAKMFCPRWGRCDRTLLWIPTCSSRLVAVVAVAAVVLDSAGGAGGDPFSDDCFGGLGAGAGADTAGAISAEGAGESTSCY